MLRPILLLVSFVAAVAGCVIPIGDGEACTDLAAVSVTATVEDAAGDPVDDADVVFTVDGGPDETACNFLSDGQYACGTEVEGEIAVTARKDGFITDTDDTIVGLTADGCHVDGEELDLVLEEE
jgi:hypothetical protein